MSSNHNSDRIFNLRVAPVEWASAVELASCQFHAYCRAGRMPTLLLFSAKTDARPFFWRC
ncbi:MULTISPECIES: hypothetical protein [unclassified Moorena]|uniref:hypothetical protein n=1 Tax=unclassified Moorena TaxID=2683338 RepID=UPI0013B7825A|nr:MULTISPECIES: hypothetical protein [unclassified Moorena]NEP32342.1 hypothetical protein [Moorena sp. SIO3B2]NEQ06442.1 hypothetical protein [Moorena sp. SIO4E2]